MSDLLITASAFLLVLLVLVLIHEMGHFMTAKFFGVYVGEFAFGFPPRLFSFKGKETTYSFNILPFGGYVNMYGLEYNEKDIEKQGIKLTPDRAFVNKKPWQKLVIILGGVIMNFLLGWIIISILFTQGVNVMADSVIIDKVIEHSVAEKVGLRPGDKIVILSHSGRDYVIEFPEDFVRHIEQFANKEITLTVERNGKQFKFKLKPTPTVIIQNVSPNSPAAQKGLQRNDLIVAMYQANSEKINFSNTQEFVKKIKELAGKEIIFEIQSGQETKLVSLVPRANPPKGEGALGIVFVGGSGGIIPTTSVLKTYPWYEAPIAGLLESAKISMRIVRELVGLVGRIFSIENTKIDVAGPVGIAQYVGEATRSGVKELLHLTALLSLNLALMNLLPIPALDGGRAIYIAYEWVTKRKMNEKFDRYSVAISFALLFALILLVTARDITKLIFGS